MQDEHIMLFMRGQIDAIEHLCHGLAGGSKADTVIADLRTKAPAPPEQDPRDEKYGTGYDLILSLASLVSKLATRAR